MIRIKNVKPLKNFTVLLELTNGKKGIIDLEPFLLGPIFEPLKRNPQLFKSVKVDSDLGTIVWENGADLDPDVLIYNLKIEKMKATKRISVAEPKSLYHTKRNKRIGI